MLDGCQWRDPSAQPITSLVRVRDDQGGLTGTRAKSDAGAVTNLEDVGRLEVGHVGRHQQVSLAGDGHLQHVPVFLVTQRVDTATKTRVADDYRRSAKLWIFGINLSCRTVGALSCRDPN